ncbi:MAG TPA: type II CAAX endopeptidase family protein [Tenuifilaceae bacterium]|nr:type II CAAX endopeptidase family protein [Tenuifilaceae bacterium]
MKNIINIIANGNDFFQLALKGKRLTHWVLILPVIIITVLLSVYIFAISADIIFGVSEEFNYYKTTYITTGMFVGIALFIILWARYFEKRKFYTLGFTKENALKKYLKGFGLGILLSSAVVGLMAIFGGVEVVLNPENSHMLKITIIVSLVIFILQGASEEILFRGWLMQVLGAKYKPIVGIIATLILFTVFHASNSGFNLLVAVNITLIAIIIILLVLDGKNLWAASGFHSSWNWAYCNIFGFTISGSDQKEFGASVLSLKGVGGTFLGGGDFGPEGSIMTTIVCVISIVFLYWMQSRKNEVRS